MKQFLLILIIGCGAIQFSFSQTTPIVQWQNTIGGDNTDNFSFLKETKDGGYIMGCGSMSDSSADKSENCLGDFDYWIIKIDASGLIQWQNTIGGNSMDIPYSITETFDNGYLVGGYSWSNISGDKSDTSKGGSDYWILKLDSTGTIQWQKTIGGNSADELYALSQTPDSGFLLAGTSYSNISGDKTENCKGGFDFWIVKIDTNGIIVWQKTIGGSNLDIMMNMCLTYDNGCILIGESYSNASGDKKENSRGGTDYWVVKLDSTGFIQWEKTIGGNDSETPLSIKQTSDGGYIIGGDSYSPISGDKTVDTHGMDDFWVLKLDSLGSIQWQKTYGGSSNDWCYAASQTSDGGYIFGGTSSSGVSGNKTESLRGIDDYWIIKTDSIGAIQLQKTIGGSDYDELISLEQTSDGGFILGGQSSSPISFEKNENCIGLCYWDYWIVKLQGTAGQAENNYLKSATISPNPLYSTATLSFKNPNHQKIKINFYNILGEMIEAEETNSDNLQIIKVNKSPGIYLASILNENTGEMVKVRFIIM